MTKSELERELNTYKTMYESYRKLYEAVWESRCAYKRLCEVLESRLYSANTEERSE